MSHQRPSWIILIHLIKDTTWPSNNKDKGAGSIIAKRREKWIQPTLAALQLFPLEIAVKKSVGARLHGKCTAFIWCIYPVSFAKPPKLLLRPLSHDKPIHTHCTYPVKGLWPCSDCQPKSVFWHIQIDFTKSGEHKTTWNAKFLWTGSNGAQDAQIRIQSVFWVTHNTTKNINVKPRVTDVHQRMSMSHPYALESIHSYWHLCHYHSNPCNW